MALSDAKVEPAIAVSDMAKAKEFYEGTLGLSNGEEQGDGGITYPVGAGTAIHVYPSENAGKSEATLAGWIVEDVEGEVDELVGKGVTMEQYGDPLNTNEKGIAEFEGGMKVAWFKDPDGNIHGLGNF